MWQDSRVTTETRHPESEADRRADRRGWLYFGAFMLASYVVDSMSGHDELVAAGRKFTNGPWLWEGTSYFVILLLTPFIMFMLSRFPVTGSSWRSNLPAHLAGILAFSTVHILLMVWLRKLLSPLIFGFEYEFGMGDASVWLYEFRKDVVTYSLIAGIFSLNRIAEQRGLELAAARREAKVRHRLTLKTGGRTHFVEVADVIQARAASNYVEVVTPDRVILARMTLTELEQLLDEAGSGHVRVHRSHLVNSDRIREITPTGEGDYSIQLDTGDAVPGSRRFRDRFQPPAV